MIARSPLRSPLSAAIENAFNVVSSLAPTPPAPSVYGATADAGEIDPKWTVTTVWSVATAYAQGDRVVDAGSVFWCIKAAVAGTLTSDTTYWQPATNSYYFGFTDGLDTYNALSQYPGYLTNTDGSQGSVNAAYGPGKTLDYVYDWMTTDSTAGGKLAPRGSIVMLKRGQSYDGFISYNNFDSSSFGNYLVGAYGTGARPLINFKQSAAQNNGSIAAFAMKRANGFLRNVKLDGLRVVSFNGAPSAAFTTGETVTGGTSGATGVYQYYAGSSYHAIALTSYPTTFSAGEVVTGGSSGSTVTVGTRAFPAGIPMEQVNCTVENVELTNLAGEGIQVGVGGAGTGNDTTIKGVTVSDACSLQSNGAGISGGNGARINITNTTVKDCGVIGGSTSHNMYFNNVTYLNLTNCWSYMTTNKGNSALVLHDTCADVLIAYNLFEKCGNGLAINDGHASAESFTRFTIRNNINRLHGTLTGQTQGLPYELTCMVDSVIYNNLVYGCFGQYSIAATRGSGGADVPTNNLTVSHETVYNVGDGSNGMRITGAVTAVTVQNMIFMSTAASGNLFEVDATALAQVTLRNCLFYMPNNAGNCIKIGATSYTLAGFKTWMDTNRPGHGCIVNTDPLFTNAATGDFTLQAGSPAKLAGYNSGIATDFAGNARHATTPSIGAYE